MRLYNNLNCRLQVTVTLDTFFYLLKCKVHIFISDAYRRHELRLHSTCTLLSFVYYKDIKYCTSVAINKCERNGKRNGAGRKSGERERSGERTFQKTLERERSVELRREAAEQRAG